MCNRGTKTSQLPPIENDVLAINPLMQVLGFQSPDLSAAGYGRQLQNLNAPLPQPIQIFNAATAVNTSSTPSATSATRPVLR